MMYKWNPEEGLALIEKERVTSFNGVPTMTWEMLQSPELEQRTCAAWWPSSGGGAPIPGGMVDQTRGTDARTALVVRLGNDRDQR